ncbi:glutamine--tRNA ligase [Paenibacillus sp. KS1]|uniref:glutamine--tRNA ligase/YqeY domain fusion protein n=1 Tax=Paenibacillus sp. KS1 TaxID=1849249 RepID=UPI00080654E1|nr:glutamine--tRNA ligase/YqeY domain fusion protein [Paenibacillus sp. KS1]OBY80497.1 glutamine--tRNA ligase [Paenibacillus sp. KS1]
MNQDTAYSTDHYLYRLIHEEQEASPFSRSMCTRFPPEPNGYLHIGSAYAIHTSYMLAKQYGGSFHLRFDDTNPLKEDIHYVHSIIEDMKWLGYDPDYTYYGSDYSEQIYQAAVTLIRKGKAYVCDLAPDEVAKYRGTLTEPGRNSPYRSRTIQENLELFTNMRQGVFPTASKVLRAKIDMSSPNMNLRDPILYRIIHAAHYRTGDDWCIYPMYDFAHPIQDAIEGITYSLCSIEFKDHRPLYEWVLREHEVPEPPRQREFGRLNLTGVVTSKRYLRQLVEERLVEGWDDPRLPTIRGLRRRGYTSESIRAFIEEIGSIRTESTANISLLDHCARQDLQDRTSGIMAVLHPLKVVITNYPEDKVEWLQLENNPHNEQLGQRDVPFSRTIFIERDDFLEQPPGQFHRLRPNGEVRLKGAYFIRCDEVIKDPATDEITELRCTYDPVTKSGTGFTGRKVKGTIHWVSAAHAVEAVVHLYENLLLEESVPKDNDIIWTDRVCRDSHTRISNVMLEPWAAQALTEQRFQFIRHGYFAREQGGENQLLEFHRIVPLKNSWVKK